MYATILRSIRDVQRLAGSPCISCNLIGIIYIVVELKHINLVFTIPNMFESSHTNGVIKN